MNSKAETQNPEPKALRAFTLIELLVVISIIALLAGLLFAVMPAVTRRSALTAARAEMGQIVSAIEAYKAAYNFYPPDSPPNIQTIRSANPLYLELIGTIMTNAGVPLVLSYVTLDGSYNVPVNTVTNTLQIGGLVNSSTSPIATDERPAPIAFLKDLRPTQFKANSGVRVLIPSVDDTKFWRYNSSNPTNNPGSYDLSFELVLHGKTNLISNWRN
jgi:prepilin-type N-terminal cleavage/methylation domain-containing protein